MKSRAKSQSQSGREFEYLCNRKGPLRCSLVCVMLSKVLSVLGFLVFFFFFFFVEFDLCFKLYHRYRVCFDYCNVPCWIGIIPSSVSICFTFTSNFTFWGKERIVFLGDCQRWWSLISTSMAWNCSQIQPVILKWFTSFIVWISLLFLANSVCENVHSCICQGFLHLTGLAGSHLPFIRRILQTRTPQLLLLLLFLSLSLLRGWEMLCTDPPWGARVPARGWMSLSLCLSSPVSQVLLMKSQNCNNLGSAEQLWGCGWRLLSDFEAKRIKQGGIAYQYFPQLKPIWLLIPYGSGISC